ncbi:MAG TPA: alpha/beta fold hydrolase [Pyrinomonadaceae bacterium]
MTITLVNQPPVASNDSYDIHDSTIIGPFLANDSDPDNDPLTCGDPRHECIVTFPQHGSLFGLPQPDKKTYSPASGYIGSDTFTYNACDNVGLCTPATVTLNISPPPTPTPTPTPTATPTPTPPPPPPPTPSPSPSPTPVEPLIFIPGIGGSALDEAPARNVWLGGVFFTDRSRLRLNNPPLDSNGQPITIVAPDVIRQTSLAGKTITVYQPLIDALTTNGDYVEYQVNGQPGRRTTGGCDLSQKDSKPNLFVFAYDWRISNKKNADSLADYVGCVQKFYPDRKVNILAHSMGGLLARRYILDNPGKAKKLITVGTPWLGAPKALYILETGNFFNIYLADRLYADLFKSLVEFFPAVHELLPSRAYYNHAGSVFGELPGKLTWDVNLSGQIEPQYTPEQLTDLLDNRQFKESKPARAGSTFHDHPGQDDWHADQSGVEYYHIYGVQYFPQTIGKVLATRKLEFDRNGQVIEKKSFDIRSTKGDGTVPVLSAERPQSFNAPGAIKRPFGPLPFGKDDNLFEHTGLVQNPDVINYILTSLKAEAQSTALNQLRSTGIAKQDLLHHAPKRRVVQDQEPESPIGTIYDLKFDGIGRPVVRDAFGNETVQLGDTPFTNPIPNVVTFVAGEDSYQLLLPAEMALDQSYTVTFQSTGRPISLDLQMNKGGPETSTLSVRYLDLNPPAGTSFIISFTHEGITDLRSDLNGDGLFETVVPPTASATGAEAQDAEAPVISFTQTSTSGNRFITINAADNFSGVKIVRYSLDGVTYRTYSGTIAIDCQIRSVYAIADDNVGNRSGVYAHETANLPPDLQLARPSLDKLWPPNHKMSEISILGVTDPECDPVSVFVTRITQDEPTNGAGDGNTCPDADGVGTPIARVRSERNGGGNGRVYTIYFAATDGRGGVAQGSVKVQVPKNAQGIAVDDLLGVDSTGCPF